MDYKKTYEAWLSNPYFDADTKKELESIAGDENEIKERFYADLEFGTAGLRGIIGAGTNRMNVYTVRKATQGLANYIIKQNGQKKGVAIAFDSHRNLQMKRLVVWQQMELKLMFLNHFDRHRNCPLPFVS